jgi:hypothetical protein
VDAGVSPLQWSSIGVAGTGSSSAIVGLGGVTGDVWALQESGALLRSQNGPFELKVAFTGGGKALFVSGGTVVVALNRALRVCTSGCIAESDFDSLSLLDSGRGYNLTSEALCGRGPSDVVAIVSDTGNQAQLFEWKGAGWTRVSSSLGVRYPRACWFDVSGVLYVVGEAKVVRFEQGAATPEPLPGQALTVYPGGAHVEGNAYVVGPSHFIARRVAGTWEQVSLQTSSGTTLWAVGGLRADEVFAFGGYHSTARNGFRWNGTSWSVTGDLLPGFGPQSVAKVLHVTGPNEFYVGGGSSSAPLIARARR